jgi:biopolymer transport protein ExbD
MTEQKFAAWLSQPENRPAERVVLRADAATRSGVLIPVMDILRDHGVKTISLVTINEDAIH